MGSKNKFRSVPMPMTEGCMDSPINAKKRYKNAKKRYEQILTLALEDAFNYENRDEIVGRVCLEMYRAQQDWHRAKAQMQITKKRGLNG